MNKKKKTLVQYEARAKIAAALAHPARLMIIDLLQTQEHSVSELTSEIGCDQSTVSKHLAILKNAGIVTMRKAGTTSFYRPACDCLDGFFSCLEQVVLVDLETRKAAAR